MTARSQDGDRQAAPVDTGAAAGAELSLVAIGASAGGIAALRSFFSRVPTESGLTFVVVMHLSPDHESHLAEVLQTDIRMPVRQVRERTLMERDRVYVIPPGHSLAVADGHVDIVEFADPGSRRAPIDMFFRTVADSHPDAVGVLLSGLGSDGAIGLKAIKEKGGLILSQSPDDAEHDGMPRAAAATGVVDFVLPASELGAKVVQLRSNDARGRPPETLAELRDGEAAVLDRILALVRSHTGHDFTGYKQSTVLRRVTRRMHVTRTATLEAYLRHLEGAPGEWAELLQDLLINVTSFFRDPAAWDAVEEQVLPAIFADPDRADAVRVWVPGCATGEEAYSIAMLLMERAGGLEVRPGIQVFATDVDTNAIDTGRRGLYPESIAADVSEERLARFFVREGAYYRVRPELREVVLFAEHNMLRDPPFARLDLLSSRNVLIYMERDLQQRVARLFHYALRPGGYLFLGSSEGMPDGAIHFDTVDAGHRIFQRPAGSSASRERLPDLPLWSRRHGEPHPAPPARLARAASDAALHRVALERHAPPSILIDRKRAVVHTSGTASRYLAYPASTPAASLLQVVRPELRDELRAVLNQALESGLPASSPWVAIELDGGPRRVQFVVSPTNAGGGAPGALVVFLETAPRGAGEDPLAPDSATGHRLERAESALGTAHHRLEDMMEHAHIREEELRSSNEELQSINEEYQSALEELETSKEELQSMNEELRAVNERLQDKVEEVARSSSDLENLVAATDIATLFVDRDLNIQRLTPAVARIFNILPADTGRPLAHITHSLSYDGLLGDCEAVIRTAKPVERAVAGPDDTTFLARITPYRTASGGAAGAVATFTEITGIREARAELAASERRFRVLVEGTAQIVWTLDPEGRALEDSPSWREFTGQGHDEWLDGRWPEVVHPDDRDRVGETWSRALAEQQPLEMEFRLWNAPRQEWRTVRTRGEPVRDDDGRVREWVGMNTDITDEKAAEAALIEAKSAAEKSDQAKSQFLSMLSHELRTPLTAIIGSSELLETGVIDPVTDRLREHLRRIKASAWHLVTIINEILTYTRSEAGKDQVHVAAGDIGGIARDVVAMLGPEAEARGLELRLHGADDPMNATTDRGKVRQIITNLVGNALKFTRDGAVHVELSATDETIEVAVRDTGPGIAPEHFEDIFEPFFQVDNSSTRTAGGTGLGLAVCRRFARALGGDIVVESTPGEGSTFTCRLPRHAAGVTVTDSGEDGAGDTGAGDAGAWETDAAEASRSD